MDPGVLSSAPDVGDADIPQQLRPRSKMTVERIVKCEILPSQKELQTSPVDNPVNFLIELPVHTFFHGHVQIPRAILRGCNDGILPPLNIADAETVHPSPSGFGSDPVCPERIPDSA